MWIHGHAWAQQAPCQTLRPIKPRLDCQERTRLSRVEGFAARRVSHLKMRAGVSSELKVSHVQNSQTIVAAETEARTKKSAINTLFIPKWRWKGNETIFLHKSFVN